MKAFGEGRLEEMFFLTTAYDFCSFAGFQSFQGTNETFFHGIGEKNIHERLQIAQKSGRYQYGKNDLYAQTIILKLLLPEDEFKLFFHDLKSCFQKHPVHQAVLERMGFPEKWDRIGRIKKYTKKEMK